MITAPTNWNDLWAAEGTVMELRLTIDEDVYYNDSLASGDCRLVHYLYDTYGVGNACFGKLNVTVTVFGRPTPVELEHWQVERKAADGTGTPG